MLKSSPYVNMGSKRTPKLALHNPHSYEISPYRWGGVAAAAAAAAVAAAAAGQRERSGVRRQLPLAQHV